MCVFGLGFGVCRVLGLYVSQAQRAYRIQSVSRV